MTDTTKRPERYVSALIRVGSVLDDDVDMFGLTWSTIEEQLVKAVGLTLDGLLRPLTGGSVTPGT